VQPTNISNAELAAAGQPEAMHLFVACAHTVLSTAVPRSRRQSTRPTFIEVVQPALVLATRLDEPLAHQPPKHCYYTAGVWTVDGCERFHHRANASARYTAVRCCRQLNRKNAKNGSSGAISGRYIASSMHLPNGSSKAHRSGGGHAWGVPTLRPTISVLRHDVRFVNQTAVYLGLLPNHYGHFLLEGLSRLWWAGGKKNSMSPPPSLALYHQAPSRSARYFNSCSLTDPKARTHHHCTVGAECSALTGAHCDCVLQMLTHHLADAALPMARARMHLSRDRLVRPCTRCSLTARVCDVLVGAHAPLECHPSRRKRADAPPPVPTSHVCTQHGRPRLTQFKPSHRASSAQCALRRTMLCVWV
jgi:hypothetical protein